MTLVLVARVPEAGVRSFQLYEDRVLGLLAGHGGELERRLASADGRTEVHVVRFASRAALRRYREDPRRARHEPLLARSGAQLELHELHDV